MIEMPTEGIQCFDQGSKDILKLGQSEIKKRPTPTVTGRYQVDAGLVMKVCERSFREIGIN